MGDAAILYCFVFLYFLRRRPRPVERGRHAQPRQGPQPYGLNARFPAHFLLYGLPSKRMPSHPHPVINEELPHDRIFELRLLGRMRACSGTGGDIP